MYTRIKILLSIETSRHSGRVFAGHPMKSGHLTSLVERQDGRGKFLHKYEVQGHGKVNINLIINLILGLSTFKDLSTEL